MRSKAPFILGLVLVIAMAVAVFLLVRPDEDGEDAAADEPSPTVADDGFALAAVQDDTGRLTVEVPEAWSDVDGRPIADQESGGQIANLQAAPDLAGFRSTFTTPGVNYTFYERILDVDGTMDFFIQRGGLDVVCTDAGRTDYDDGEFVGRLQRLENCGNSATTVVYVVANPADGSDATVEVVFHLTADDPVAVGDRILATFGVNG
jgi:serine protease Do